MPQRITNVAITLHREGQRIDINAGTLYNFTKEELEQLKSLNPDAVRLPRNESVVIDHNADNGGQQISDGGANSGDDNNTDGTKTVKAAKQAGAAKGSAAKDEKKASDAGKKEEGSDPADDGSDL